MNLLPSENDSPFASGCASLLGSPLPSTNPFESHWQSATDESSPKKTPKKRLFAKFFSRQNKPKQQKSTTLQKPHFEILPSHTSVSSASTGFPKVLVEPSSHASGSRSIASGSIYTSFSSATTDTQRKEMTSDNLLRGAQDVFGALVQLSQPRDMRHRQPTATSTHSSPIVGSTILIAPKSDAPDKTESSPTRRLQQQQMQVKEVPVNSHSQREALPNSPPRIPKQTPAGCKLQTSTPAAPMRYQEHTTLYPTLDMIRGPPTLHRGGVGGGELSDARNGSLHLPAFSPMPQPPAMLDMPRDGTAGFSSGAHGHAGRDATVGHSCSSCGSDSFQIRDTDYIVCPKCHVMERLTTASGDGGLPFTGSDIMMQE